MRQHEAIAAAIRAEDPRAAARAMHRHVETVGNVRLLDWESEAEQED